MMASATRSPSSPMDANDERPISLRRKRRASYANLQSSPSKPEAQSILNGGSRRDPKTPARPKRVRFSFPPDASTGLTERVARTQLLTNADEMDAPTARLLARKPRRQLRAASLGCNDPVQLSSNNIELQFKPIRQVLSERTKRRLTRNRLSEAMNEIDAERRSHTAMSRELQQVKLELEELSASQIPAVHDSEKIRELETEIEVLREQLHLRQSETSVPTPADSDIDVVDLIETGLGQSDNEHASVGAESPVHSGAATPTTPVSLFASGQHSNASTPCMSRQVQTDESSLNFDNVQEHLQNQVNHFKKARLALERMFPGETALPLASPTKNANDLDEIASPVNFPFVDAEPLINAMLGHLSRMSGQVASASNSLAAAENQRSNMNNHFRAALHQLTELRSAHATLLAQSQQRNARTPAPSPASSSTSSSDSDQENAPPSGSDVSQTMSQEAQKRIHELEEMAATYTKDRSALIAALDKYRSEVKDLEKLISTMEAEHKAYIQRLRSEQSDAVAQLVGEHTQAIRELESQIEAESKDRQEAELEIDRIVCRWGDQRERSDRDTGRLNVQIATLTDDLKERDELILELQRQLSGIQDRIELFVSNVGGQVEWADLETGSMATEEPELPANPAQRAKSMPPAIRSCGLLTPSVEGGRFRNAVGSLPSPDLSSDPAVIGASVVGKVEICRGKKRFRNAASDQDMSIVLEEADEK